MKDNAPAGAPAPKPLTVRLAHASPGRIRLRLDRATSDLAALSNIQRRLQEHNGTFDLGLNETTRSLLVTYNPASHQLSEVLDVIGASGVLVVAADPEVSANPPPDTTALGYAIENAAGRLNQWVSDRTSGGADLRTAVPVGFALLALREVLSGRAIAAPWYALAWYAFDSYLKLRHTERGQDSADR